MIVHVGDAKKASGLSDQPLSQVVGPSDRLENFSAYESADSPKCHRQGRHIEGL
jgi:hypothetical protein